MTWTHKNSAITCWAAVGVAPVRDPKKLNDLLRGKAIKDNEERKLYIMFFDQLLKEVYDSYQYYPKLYRSLDLTAEQQLAIMELHRMKLLYVTPCFEACSYKKNEKGVADLNSTFIFQAAHGIGGFNESQHEVLLPPGQSYNIVSCETKKNKFTVTLARSGANTDMEKWNANFLKENELVMKPIGVTY